jgi:hypothetical protein
MKPKAVLVVSVLLNVALAGALIYFATNRSKPGQQAVPEITPATVTPKPEVKHAQTTTVITGRSVQSFDWRMVESEDYRKYIANLRAIGCPEETIRDIIIADVNKLFEQRRRELTASTNKFQFWKATSNPFAQAIDPDRVEKIQALNKEKRALLKELLGVEPEEKAEFLAGFNPFETMLDFLPASKQNQIMDIFMKFQAKQTKLFEGGTPDAEDMKQMRKLRKDMNVEMAALLSPQEYDEYQLRMSDTAMGMRMQLGSFDPSEQEFRDIFQSKKKFDDEYGGMFGGGNMSKEERDKMNAAQKDLNSQIKSLLGDTRYAEYERSQDWAFQSIYRVTERNGLPKESAVQVYDMKKLAEEQASKVRKDQSLTPEQRQETLFILRMETENTIQKVLKDKAWNSYQNQPGNNWLRNISPDAKTGE